MIPSNPFKSSAAQSALSFETINDTEPTENGSRDTPTEFSPDSVEYYNSTFEAQVINRAKSTLHNGFRASPTMRGSLSQATSENLTDPHRKAVIKSQRGILHNTLSILSSNKKTIAVISTLAVLFILGKRR
jgi:hypothetical protein